jgi:hypothetical protein
LRGAARPRSIAIPLFAAGFATVLITLAAGARAGETHRLLIKRTKVHAEVSSGDYVAAGYSFKIPGPHPDAGYWIANATVTLNGVCDSGETDSLTIPLAPGRRDPAGAVHAFAVAADNHHWLPTGRPNSADSYQGSARASVCDDDGALDAREATLRTDVQSTALDDRVLVRFHYVDPKAKNKPNVDCTQPADASDTCNGPWSGPKRFLPAPLHATPSITTIPSIVGIDSSGFGTARDNATLVGALEPTGTLTYSVYNSFSCFGFPDDTSTVVVDGPDVPPSKDFMFLPPGPHQFVAEYSGDAINDPVASSCGDELLFWSHD